MKPEKTMTGRNSTPRRNSQVWPTNMLMIQPTKSAPRNTSSGLKIVELLR